MRRAQPWLGTLVDISVDTIADAQAMAAAFSAIALVHKLMSFHDPASDVARFNRAAPGALVDIDPHTWEVLRVAEQIGLLSGGCFDVACAPRLVAWDYLPPPSSNMPSHVPGASTYTLAAHGQVRKTAPAWIDLGGIAKGYAVDLAIAALRAHGADSACVNAGGDLRVIGPRDWPISVRAPSDPAAMGAQLMVRDAALATSAAYFSAKDSDAGPVSALVDGRDGRALTGRASVTVHAPACILADALTKVVMASGDAQHPCLARYGASALII